MIQVLQKSDSSRQFKIQIGGKDLIIETGRFADQANGSVTVRYGDTLILATVVMAKKPREDVDYFPLMVDYQERLYAAGKIKSSRFIKREGKPSDEAVLSSRVIDRSIRPLFPQHILQDIQVIVDVFSVDRENDSDIPAIIGASTAIAISDIPFQETVAACRVGRIDGQWVLNPTFKARKKSELDLIIAATKDKTVMLEGKADEIPEDIFFEAIKFGKKHIRKVISLIEEIKKETGKKKLIIPQPKFDPKFYKQIENKTLSEIERILYSEQKRDREHLKAIRNLQDKVIDEFVGGEDKEKEMIVKRIFNEILEKVIKENILKKERRIGGRKLDEIRPLKIEVGLLPRVHGSGYFKRGATETLTSTTLGGPSYEQLIEDMEEEYKKRFMHHYNFPPYSVGEVQPLRGPSRRDIGHGALVEKALEALIPAKEDFPYTIRLVSEVLSSNGSSSMASVCSSSLALMDAGVPIKKACAGIAMGLISDENGNYRILTDLQDLEDTKGGMDFKIAGTDIGITACQMDTKSLGLSDEIVLKTLSQARTARLQLLKEMAKVIDQPRPNLSPYAPKIITLHINPEKIRDVIGPQGKVINEIINKTGVEINIEEDGLIEVSSTDEEAAKKAVDWIKDITREIKVGEQFTGKITRIVNFGVFVELYPGMEGLIHRSHPSLRRIRNLEQAFNINDIVSVKVVEIDQEGRVNLALVRK